MKLQTTALAAALVLSANVFSVNAFADDKSSTKKADTAASKTTATDDRYVHGQTVRGTAQRDATGKPILPPGETVRPLARTQGDFMKLDTDKDGSLSADELSADAELNLAALDSDGNGVVSRTEFNTSLASSDADEDFEDDSEMMDEEE